MSGLKPCPFCGEHDSAILTQVDKSDPVLPGLWRTHCFACGCGTGHFDAHAEAIAAWNRRHAPPPPEPGEAARRAAEQIVEDVARVRVDSSAPFSAGPIAAIVQQAIDESRGQGWVSVDRLPDHWRLSGVDASILASGREASRGCNKVTVTLIRSPEDVQKWHGLARDVDPDDDPEEWAELPSLYIRVGGETIEQAFDSALAEAESIPPLPAPPEDSA